MWAASSRYTKTGSELATENNLPLLADMYRYRGSNPNNWVCFGDSSITESGSCDENHKWRIIGIDSTGKMKIMTNYYYGENKFFDRTGGQYGNNDWGRPADLNTELNGSAFYSNNNYIDGTHRKYITNATWYTGGTPTSSSTLQNFIDAEKSSNSTGYVGLMSMTDFGYAGSSCTTDANLLKRDNACMSNNWIGNAKYQWTITPWNNYTYGVWYVADANGYIYAPYASYDFGVRPSVYLNSNIKITEGSGTESDPYMLKLDTLYCKVSFFALSFLKKMWKTIYKMGGLM